MIKYSYPVVEDEVMEKYGEMAKRTATFSKDDAEVDDIVRVLKRLDAQGLDITVKISTKVPKG